jgi:hypothetical protein
MGLFGRNIVVGAPSEASGTGAGSAALFDSKTGLRLVTYTNPIPRASDFFGYPITVSKKEVLISEVQDDDAGTSAGCVHIYDGATGVRRITLANPAPNAADLFGYSVVVTKTGYFVGAPWDDTDGSNCGIVYHFGTAGNFIDAIHNPEPGVCGSFGIAMAGITDSLFIAAPTGSPRVYHMSATTGQLVRTLVNPSTDNENGFGNAVAAASKYVLVGAPYEVAAGEVDSAGAAYLFATATGLASAPIANPAPFANGNFGESVALTRSRMLIGASRNAGSGHAYEFDVKSHEFLLPLNHPSPEPGDSFGAAVLFGRGKQLCIGSPGDDPGATNAGSVFLMQGR